MPPPSPPPPQKTSWLTRLKTGLAKTGSNLTSLFVGAKVDEALFEELETTLLMADAGVDATAYLIDELRSRARKERIEDAERLRSVLAEILVELLRPLEKALRTVAIRRSRRRRSS